LEPCNKHKLNEEKIDKLKAEIDSARIFVDLKNLDQVMASLEKHNPVTKSITAHFKEALGYAGGSEVKTLSEPNQGLIKPIYENSELDSSGG
jgi:hypothetical protein